MSLHHELELRVDREGVTDRRSFLRYIPAAAAAAGLLSWTDRIRASAADLRQQGKACILLWMSGGPSQFDTLSPLPGHENGGGIKAIDTAVPGIQISENLPELAKQMNEVCLLRSLTAKEGSHPRATFLMHTGYIPSAGLKYPELGSNVAAEIGDPQSELPSFVKIGGRGQGANGAGFLGVAYDPFVVNAAGSPPENATVGSTRDRYQRRLGLLDRLEGGFEEAGGAAEVADHRKLYEKAAKMVTSPKMQAFDLARESSATRSRYGGQGFGAACLLARRLLEQGVTFVEINSGGWDTHQDNQEATKRLCGQIDRPWAALLQDLKERGMLDKTLVIWAGEFGRTPRINARGGRDHYPRAFSAALAGCGVKGGQVIGAVDRSGAAVEKRPIQVNDFFQTICHALEIDAGKERQTSIGRPIKIVDGGQPVLEVFG